MKTFTIAIHGSFSVETDEQAAEVAGRLMAAGKLAFNALPEAVEAKGAVTMGGAGRDGYHQKEDRVSYVLERDVPAVPVVLPPPADVTDVPAGS